MSQEHGDTEPQSQLCPAMAGAAGESQITLERWVREASPSLEMGKGSGFAWSDVGKEEQSKKRCWAGLLVPGRTSWTPGKSPGSWENPLVSEEISWSLGGSPGSSVALPLPRKTAKSPSLQR